MGDVNYLAVLVAAISSMVVGSIWYGPLFRKAFVSAHGWDKLPQEQQDAMKKGMTKLYVVQFIASLVMFYVLAMMMSKFGLMGVSEALKLAFWIWLGFVATLKLGDSLWGGKMTLFWLGAGNSLVTLLVGAAIIGAWR